MKCMIDGCDRDAAYKGEQLCQKHYFRRMRNGTFDLLPKKRKERIENKAGYQKIFSPDHPLANSDGYAYEHRIVVYEEFGDSLPDCEICGKGITWRTCHIDHIDGDVRNNRRSNLRPLCRVCNTFRSYPEQHTLSRARKITYNGKTMTASEWARVDGVKVTHATIVRRINSGLSVHDALFSDRKTHRSHCNKKAYLKTEYMRKLKELQNGKE